MRDLCWANQRDVTGSKDETRLMALCALIGSRLGRNELHELCGVKFLKRFSVKFVIFSPKLGSLNVQIRNNYKNIIYIACKWSKICKYYVNITLISCTTCQKKENNTRWLNIWFTLSCRNIKFVVITRFFPPNLCSHNFRVHKKMVFPSLIEWFTIVCRHEDDWNQLIFSTHVTLICVHFCETGVFLCVCAYISHEGGINLSWELQRFNSFKQSWDTSVGSASLDETWRDFSTKYLDLQILHRLPARKGLLLTGIWKERWDH